MSEPADQSPAEFPELSTEGNAGSASSQRAAKPYRASAGALIVAVILGAGIAFAAVRLIPEIWNARQSGKSADRSTRDDPAGTSPDDSENPIRNGAKSDSRPPSPINTPEKTKPIDPSTKAADKREREAIRLLAKAKQRLATKKPKRAQKILEDILNRYEATNAAVEAERLLLAM